MTITKPKAWLLYFCPIIAKIGKHINFRRTVFFLCLSLVCFQVNAQLLADFKADQLVGCPPFLVQFTDLSSGSPTSYFWDLGNGTTSTQKNPGIIYFNPGSYTVKLVIRNGTAVDSIVKSQYIVVNDLPSPDFKASDTSGCYPLKVFFSDLSIAGSGQISSWQWDFGDGNISTDQNPVHTYTKAGNFNVLLNVTNSNGCAKVITKTRLIKLQNGVKAAFSYSSNQGCQTSAQVNFLNQSTGNGILQYLWNFGNGNTSILQNPSTNYNAVGSYTIQLVVSNNFGCKDTIIKQNAINIGLVKADFSKPDTVCTGAAFQLNNISTPNSFVSSLWSFGDGSFSTDAVPSYAYSSPGTYTVKLVTDFGSCKDSTEKTIVSIPKPTASFTLTNNLGCKAPLTVNFTSTSTDATTYKWKFGDGGTSTLQNPNHTYNASGKYSVTLIVTNAKGCIDSIVKTDVVNIAPPNISSIDRLPITGCIPLTISPLPIIESSLPITSYQWDFGDGSTSTSASPTYTYNTSGSFTVRLIVSTATGCSDTLILPDAVKAGTRPKSNFGGSPLNVCANTPVIFTDSSSGNLITDWYWDFGDGVTVSGVQNPSHLYNDTGKYDVMLVAYNFGCSDTLIKTNFIHVKPPIARFGISYNCNSPFVRNFSDSSIGASSWAWSFGDGGTDNVKNPSHTYAAPGTYPVSLTVSDGTCQHTLTKNIRVLKQQGVLSISNSFSCRNARLTFDIKNVDTGSLQKFDWYFEGIPGTFISTSNYPVAQSYSVAGIRTPAVIVTDILNCVDTFYASVPVTVYGPKALFGSDIKGSCFGGVINFLDSSISDGIHPITSWTWNYGDGKTKSFNSGPFPYVYTSPGKFDVSLLVKDSYGCVDSLLKPAYISISQVKADFVPSDTLLCPQSVLLFTNNSSGTDVTYKWYFGDNTFSNAFSPSHIYNTSGIYTVSLVVKDKVGCKDSIAQQIKVFAAKADFSLNDSFSTCPPLVLNTTNNSTNYIDLNWDFGDGIFSTVQNPSHIYTYPGKYVISLAVLNNGGCSDTMRKTIIINGPIGSFAKYNTQACNPGTINYTINAQNTVKYIWDFGDGTTLFSNQNNTSHTYTIPGLYEIKVILQDGIGCKVAITGNDTIKITGINTDFKADKLVLCDSGFIAFSDSTKTNDTIKTYQWQFGDGGFSTAQNPVHLYTMPGLYSVKLIANTTFGCTDTLLLNNYIKVVSTPRVKILGDSIGCAPAQISFDGALIKPDTSIIKWNWFFDNGNTSFIQTPPIQPYNNTGVYNIRLIASIPEGCSDTAKYTTTIYNKPTVDAGLGGIICNNQTIQLIPSGADTYTWTANPTLSCLLCDTTIASPKVKTTYYVTGTTTIGGCKNTDSVKVEVKQPFKIIVSKGDSICKGEFVTLKASGTDNYEWKPATWLDNPFINNPTSRPDTSITYMVVGQDSGKCYTDTGFVKIKVYPIPTVNITNGNSVTLEVGKTITLNTQTSSDVIKLSWFPPQGLSCITCNNPVVSTRENKTYTVKATNAGNCSSSDEITITMSCGKASIFIPNTFSPNGDGMNDAFYPRGNGLGQVKSLRIFNRWGQMVFQKKEFAANDPVSGWDGKMNGVDLPSDVYVYFLEVYCINNEVVTFKDNVSLLR